MKIASSVLALLATLTMPSSISAGAPVACTSSELEHITKTAAAQGGIIHACQTDTGFKLYPFADLPAGDDQQRHVCSGRSCPTAISNLKEANLPECLIAVGSGNDSRKITTEQANTTHAFPNQHSPTIHPLAHAESHI